MQKPATRITISTRDVIRILVLITAFVLAIYLCVTLIDPIIWIAAGFVLAVALNPAVEFFAKRLRNNRLTAIAIVLALAIAVVGLVAYSIVPPFVEQTEQLVAHAPQALHDVQRQTGPIPDLLNRLHLDRQLSQVGSNAAHYFTTATGSAIAVAGTVFHGVAAAVTIIVITVMMLAEGPGWLRRLWTFIPSERLQHDQALARQMYRAVTGYVSGNLITSAIAALTAGILLAILGVPYVVALALIVGFLDLIPLVGATMAAIIVVVVALVNSIADGVVMAVFFLIYQQLENHILQPLVYGRSTKLSPLTVIVAIILGSSLAGLFGALVAIPVASCVQILLVDYLKRRPLVKE